ncbi:MAG: acetolactate synthase large subunit [Spirochaetota bacterium]|nr:acetolactate synthase large subunit [Spirochaetota bacterium]
MTGAELLVKCLENEGVATIFGVPGEENLDVMDALLDSNIKFIQTRHEQGAAFMADVYGRLTGKAGVCLSTLGPGATNLITGVADANMDHAPLVAITGQGGLDRMHKESHQYMDLVAIFHPITKWNTQIKKTSVIPEVVRKAFKLAQTEKTGATHIDLPEDIAESVVDGNFNTPLLMQQAYPPSPPIFKVGQAAKIISEAKYPIILAGNGVARGHAHEELLRFAETQNIPVAHTFMGKGVIPHTSDLSLFTIGLQAKDYVSCGFDRADVVIAIGYDIVEYHPSLWNPNRDKKIIHVDMSPAEVDASYIVSAGVIGDIKSSLEALNEKSTPHNSNLAKNLHDVIAYELHKYENDTGFPIKPQKAISDIRRVMGDDDILISDVGAHKMWIARMYPCMKPNTCLISNGFASMGIALPGALSAKYHFPDKKVLAVTGDGGFLMNSQELETAMRVGVPFVTLIFNDNSYGLIEWKQMNRFKRASHVNLTNPDFVKYAESFGAKGYKIHSSDELIPILNDAFSQKVPSVIDCPVDYSENLKLTEQFGKLICPI